MTEDYKVFRVHKHDKGMSSGFEQQAFEPISAEQVRIKVQHSSINYKDALGVTGKGKIFRKFPIVPGIDAVGQVVESKYAACPPGSTVVVTGCGLGELHDGGYGEYVSVPGDWVVKLPDGLSMKEAMILGTAGFTAAICVHRLELNGLKPGNGPVLVTGASGGVGSVAIDILSARSYEVVAVSGKSSAVSYLESIGAKKVISPDQLMELKKPLESVRYSGAIDNLGGKALEATLSCIDLWGSVASVGLALNHELHTTVMPFILRGVSLLGISSANCPYPLRRELWKKLAGEYKPRHLDEIVKGEVPLSQIEQAFVPFIERKTSGRYIVNCQE
ncbi:MAG: YhdH/YhfP family quinone oxidoreductase [Oligoflexales bacterium]